MNKVKFDIPSGMLEAAREAHRKYERSEPGVFLTGRIVEAVLLWIAENAPVPTQDQLSKIPTSPCGRYDWPICLVEEWERRMFLAKGSKVPNYKRLE